VEELEIRALLSATAAGIVAHPGVQTGTISNPTQSPFTPAAIRAAYAIDQITFAGGKGGSAVAADGAGETIAIVDAFTDPNLTGDLAVFDHTFGLPAPPSFTILNQNGTPSLTNVPLSGRSSFGLEEDVDIEWAHAIAPAANIVLFEANSNSFLDLGAADLTAANPATYTNIGVPAAGVVSNSFFAPEGPNAATQVAQSSEQLLDGEFFQPISAKGNVSLVTISGDAGNQSYPGTSPYVLSVGGTALSVQTDKKGNVTYGSETAWNLEPDANEPSGFLGGGGGTSFFEPEPTFQQAAGINNTGGFRATPDVSIDASDRTPVNVVDTFDFPNANPAQEFAFGTSIGAPMWAGLLAITDQGRALQGVGPLANAQEAVYQIASTDFHDVASGSNLVASAGPGYDEVTGLGTPIANFVVHDLINARTGPVTFTAPAVVSSATTSGAGGAAKAGGSAGTDAVDMSADALPSLAATDAVRLEAQVTTVLTPAVSIAATTALARAESTAVAAPSAHGRAVADGAHDNAETTIAPTDTKAVPNEAATPTAADDLQTPAAAPVLEATVNPLPAMPATGASDAVFADYGSTPAIDLSSPAVESQPSTPPTILAGEQAHPIDLAMMAGLALLLGGSWSANARAKEARKYPALRS
jgi:hypothetical protein